MTHRSRSIYWWIWKHCLRSQLVRGKISKDNSEESGSDPVAQMDTSWGGTINSGRYLINTFSIVVWYVTYRIQDDILLVRFIHHSSLPWRSRQKFCWYQSDTLLVSRQRRAFFWGKKHLPEHQKDRQPSWNLVSGYFLSGYQVKRIYVIQYLLLVLRGELSSPTFQHTVFFHESQSTIFSILCLMLPIRFIIPILIV
jgi:hypothetical protein